MNCCSQDEAIALLRSGHMGVMPTDTIYGVVACAADHKAVTRLYALKRRERKPGTIIAASVQQLIGLGFSSETLRRVANLWPDPLSIVLPVDTAAQYLDQGVGSLALRIPRDKRVRAIVEQTGPLVTSSANQPGQPPAETISDAYDYFRDDVDFYVDGGRTAQVIPSTIIKIEDDNRITILREGAVSKAQLPPRV